MLDPPPPAPVSAHQKKPPWLSLDRAAAALLHRPSTFQTVSVPYGYRGCGLVPGLKDSSEVPPTLVTQGCEGGSSTARPVVPSDRMQEKAPQGRVGEGDGDGDGLGVPDTGDPAWLGVAEADGVADRDGVAERLGLGLRDGVGVGLGAVGVWVGDVLGLVADWPGPVEAGPGGTTTYHRASTARNSAVSTMVEVRGRRTAGCRTVRREPLMMPRWRGRCRGRRRR